MSKFIVIDGTDGSGKTTQANLLIAKLKAEGYQVEMADFPQYNHKSAGPVEEYLSGKYGEAGEVDPYVASIFYAVDRFDIGFKIRQWLQEEKFVIANRYVSSNMGHQGSKITNALKRKEYFDWLYHLEYEIFKIPRPDLSLILHVPSKISQQLSKDRGREDWHGKTKDIHEDNLEHLLAAEEAYMEIAKNYPSFALVECTQNDQLLSREAIADLVWQQVQKIIKL
jgi:dTMP kinase